MPRQLLQAARDIQVQLYTSTPLLLELTDILGRVKFARRVAAAQLSVDQLVERYALLATVVHPAAIAPTVLDDPDDDQVLACALAAKAELIVSGDRHLLDLKARSERFASRPPRRLRNLPPGRDINSRVTPRCG